MNVLNAIFALGPYDEFSSSMGLPWEAPDDLKRFRDITEGNVVVMGRKTWESLPKRPLKGRTNVVVTSAVDKGTSVEIRLGDEPHTKIGWLNGAFWQAKKGQDIFVIGGLTLIKEAMPLVRRVYITHIKSHAMLKEPTPTVTSIYTPDLSGFRLVSEEDSENCVFQIWGRVGC
jgi:dihydrofolate reductase